MPLYLWLVATKRLRRRVELLEMLDGNEGIPRQRRALLVVPSPGAFVHLGDCITISAGR